ncbi:MAG: hypothetical protein ACTSXZ_06110 [Alphaproteobacteria bacterium]
MRKWLILAVILLAVGLCTLGLDCGDDDDGGNDDDTVDDDTADDDVTNDDTIDDDIVDDDTDDDVVDDDIVDDDTMPEPARGWLSPCDVDGDGVPDYVLEDQFLDSGSSQVTITLKNTDGTTVTEMGPVDLGTSGYSYHYLADIDGDDLCEIISLQQKLVLDGPDLKADSRVMVLQGAKLAVAYDSGWTSNVFTFVYVDIDINGDGQADLLINHRPDLDANESWLIALDAAADYEEIWTLTGNPGEGLMLHARAVDGFTRRACGDPAGPDAFLLERYDLYDDESPQWSAQWIDREGNELGSYGPIDLKQPALNVAGLMHLSEDDWQCAGFVAYPTANLFGSRFVLFDRAGEVLADGDLGDVSAISGTAAMSLDGNEAPDVVLYGTYSDGAPALWVASDQDDYALTEVIADQPAGSYRPVGWRLHPWLRSTVDLMGEGTPTFAILPYADDMAFALAIPLFGVDLAPVDFSYILPLPTGDLISTGGIMLPLAGKDTPVLAVYAVTSESGAPWTKHSTWGVFAGEEDAPLYQRETIDGAFALFCPLWDFNGDDQPEICELRYPTYGETGGEVRLFDSNNGFVQILLEAAAVDHRLNLIGAWK